MKYHEMLKELRLSAGLTQKQLGMECGLPEGIAGRTVQRWELGESFPRSTILRRIAAALNVPVDKVVPWDEKQQ